MLRPCLALRNERVSLFDFFSAEEMVAELNPVLRGWAGYFCLGPAPKPTERSTRTLGIGSASGGPPNTKAPDWTPDGTGTDGLSSDSACLN